VSTSTSSLFRALIDFTNPTSLKILQSTITGVVLLHLLLIPGTAFLTGGARIWEQNLHPHPTQLNHSLLTIGVLAILLPTAFFAALDRGVNEPVANDAAGLIKDSLRGDFLKMSHGLAIILLVICMFATHSTCLDRRG
jgi:Ca2+:H+ antiporter